MEKDKVILWGGIGGCLFSALWGIVGGVSFLTVMIRALLGGGFFALLLGSSVWIMEKFLPELLQPMEEEKEGGTQVDLVIPEHNPHLTENTEEITEPLSGASGFEDFVEEVEEISKPFPSPNPEESAGATVLPDEQTIDDLPDLGGFADAFEGGSSTEALTPGMYSGSEREKALDGGDPAVIAKAIQTLLKKDKEG